MKSCVMIFCSLLIFTILFAGFVGAQEPKEGFVKGGPVCNKIVENAGSVRLINFSPLENFTVFNYSCDENYENCNTTGTYDMLNANITIEVTVNDYFGSSFLGFFHPMKVQAYDESAGELTEEESVAGEGSLVKVASAGLRFAKYSSLDKYPIVEKFSFMSSEMGYTEGELDKFLLTKKRFHFILTTKTIWDSFSVNFIQGDLGVIEFCLDQPDGICPTEKECSNQGEPCGDAVELGCCLGSNLSCENNICV